MLDYPAFHFDRASVLEKEDWNRVASLFTNVKQLATIVQDGARKLADYANIRGQSIIFGMFSSIKGVLNVPFGLDSVHYDFTITMVNNLTKLGIRNRIPSQILCCSFKIYSRCGY